MNSASKISKLIELLRKQIQLLHISTHWEKPRDSVSRKTSFENYNIAVTVNWIVINLI